MKIFWFDTETTGVDPSVNSIVQLAGLVEVDGKVVDEKMFEIQPPADIEWNPGTVKVTGITREMAREYEMETYAWTRIRKWFLQFIDPYDKTDKFYAGGYNVKFDVDMLSAMWDRNHDSYFRSFFFPVTFDVMTLLAIAQYIGVIEALKSYKLGDVVKALCVKHEKKESFHDALTDIKVTRATALTILATIQTRVGTWAHV
jgi:DNA polymerase III alpha subunit (gram-positive type)